MKEERMAILQMVAEKKISAEEAAQLLEALGASEPGSEQSYGGTNDGRRHRSGQRRKRKQGGGGGPEWQEKINDLSEDLSSIFGNIGGIFGSTGGFGCREDNTEEQTVEIKAGAEIAVNNMAGKLTVKGCEEGPLRLASRGLNLKRPQIQVNEAGDEVQINAMGQHLMLDTPRNISALKLNTAGGKMDLNDIHADCNLQVAGGAIRGSSLRGKHRISMTGGSIHLEEIVSQEMFIKLQGGSCRLGLAEINEGSIDIQMHGGRGVINLPADADCTVDISMEKGRIHSNIPGEHQKQDENATFHARCGEGAASIRIEAHHGHIEVNRHEQS